MKIVEVNDLSFSYDTEENGANKKMALNNVSFSIDEGEYTVILGHNGSGKSTIAKLLIGLLEKQSGKIIIDGIELNEKTIYEIRNKIGIVFQNPDNQFIGTTVRDDLAFGLENRCVDRNLMDDIIYEYATKVNMQDFLDAQPYKLSGGQKQRVAIAGILAMHFDIIIFDEATSMLDPQGKKDILNLIQELNDEKKVTIISITHDIEEAVNADKVIVLNQGEIYKIGKSNVVLNDEVGLKIINLDASFATKLSNRLSSLSISTTDKKELIDKLWQLHLNK